MKRVKLTAFLAVIVAVAISFAGCGSASLPRPQADVSKIVDVTGSCDMKIENNKAIVECKSDMIDGTIFRLSVESPEAKQLAYKDIVKNGDNLKAEFDLTNFNETSYYGFATSAPALYGNQPDAVLNKYGKKYENIKSDQILWTMDSCILVISSGVKKK